MPPPPLYRVEHRHPHRTRVLGVLAETKPTGRLLDPFLSRLLLAGETGWLVLVEEATGVVAVRRRVKPPGTRYRPSRRRETPATRDPTDNVEAPALSAPLSQERAEVP